ncbi:hypothetical protein [Methylobacterium nigriterrae]|uniref:hypothetical protein n=1 Tax=Methylobacterium nigriterrae TaxID=3127512 RepID=UPI0030135876
MTVAALIVPGHLARSATDQPASGPVYATTDIEEPRPALTCPVSRAVFLREEDKARFVADAYGVNLNVQLGELNEVISGWLDGRRAYLFVMHASDEVVGVISPWRDSFYPRHNSEGPTMSTLGASLGPLRGHWILAECQPRAPLTL